MQQIKHRNKITAVILSLLSFTLIPGIGQLYGGRLAKSFLFLSILFITALSGALGIMSQLLGAILIYAIIFLTLLYFAYDTYKINTQKDGMKLHWYNRWYFYTTFIVIFFTFNWINNSILANYKHFRMAATSPTLQIGDIVMAKMNYGRNPGFHLISNEFFDFPVIVFSSPKYEKGSFVFFNQKKENGETKTFIRKIIATEGETFKNSIKVPKNSVLVDMHDGTQTIAPYQNIEGKALYILWSRDFSKIGSSVRDTSNLARGNTMSKNFYIGKTVLVGISYYDNKEKLKSNKQIAGKIIEISKNKIAVQLLNSVDIFNLPPDVSALQPAQPGILNLKNGNVKSIEDPDFTVVYNVYENQVK